MNVSQNKARILAAAAGISVVLYGGGQAHADPISSVESGTETSTSSESDAGAGGLVSSDSPDMNGPTVGEPPGVTGGPDAGGSPDSTLSETGGGQTGGNDLDTDPGGAVGAPVDAGSAGAEESSPNETEASAQSDPTPTAPVVAQPASGPTEMGTVANDPSKSAVLPTGSAVVGSKDAAPEETASPGLSSSEAFEEPGATIEASRSGSPTLAPTAYFSASTVPVTPPSTSFTQPTVNTQSALSGLVFFGLPLLGGGTTTPVNPIPLAVLAWARRTQQLLANRTPTVGTPTSVYDPTSETIRGSVGITDSDGDRLVYSVTDAPDRGTLVINPDGTYVYTPNGATAQTGGTDTFSVKASDNTAFHLHGLASLLGVHRHSATTTVSVTVPADNNQVPIVDPSAVPQVGAPDPLTGVVTGSVSGIVTDPDGDPIRYSSTDPLIVVDPITGAFTFTPTGGVRHQAAFPGASQTRPVVILVSDDRGGHVEVSFDVDLSPVNQSPAATGQSPAFVTDPASGSVTGSLLGTVSDGDGDPLRFTGPTTGVSAQGGVVTVTESGGFVYIPTVASRYAASDQNAQGGSAFDTFTITVTDGLGQPTTVTVTVPIERVGPTVSVAGTPTIYSSPVVDSAGTTYAITQQPSGSYQVTSVATDGTTRQFALPGEPTHPMRIENGSLIVQTNEYVDEHNNFQYYITVIRDADSHSAALIGRPDSARPLVVDATGTVYQITTPTWTDGIHVTAVNATGSTTRLLPGATYAQNVVVSGTGTGFVPSWTFHPSGGGFGSRPDYYEGYVTVIGAQGSSEIVLPEIDGQNSEPGPIVTDDDGNGYLVSAADLFVISADGSTVTTFSGLAGTLTVSGDTVYVSGGGQLSAVTAGVATSVATFPGNTVGGVVESADRTTLFQTVTLVDGSTAVMQIRNGEVTQLDSVLGQPRGGVVIAEDGSLYQVTETSVDTGEGPVITTTLTAITDDGTYRHTVEGRTASPVTTFAGGAFVTTVNSYSVPQMYRILAVRGSDSFISSATDIPAGGLIVEGDAAYQFAGYLNDLTAIDADGSTTTGLNGTRFADLVTTDDHAYQLVRSGTFGSGFTASLLVVSSSDTDRIELPGEPVEIVSVGTDIYVVTYDSDLSKTHLTVVSADGTVTRHAVDGTPGGSVLATDDAAYLTTITSSANPTSADQFTTTVRTFVGSQLIGTMVLPGNSTGGAVSGADGTVRQTVVTGDAGTGYTTRTVTITPAGVGGSDPIDL